MIPHILVWWMSNTLASYFVWLGECPILYNNIRCLRAFILIRWPPYCSLLVATTKISVTLKRAIHIVVGFLNGAIYFAKHIELKNPKYLFVDLWVTMHTFVQHCRPYHGLVAMKLRTKVHSAALNTGFQLVLQFPFQRLSIHYERVLLKIHYILLYRIKL